MGVVRKGKGGSGKEGEEDGRRMQQSAEEEKRADNSAGYINI